MSRHLVCVFLTTLLVIVQTVPASAVDNASAADGARVRKLIRDPNFSQAIVRAAASTPVIRRQACPTTRYALSVNPVILKPFHFDSDGRPITGDMKMRAKSDGCGFVHFLNVIVSVSADRHLTMTPTMVGTTRVDPPQQHDVELAALRAAQASVSHAEACAPGYIVDTVYNEPVGFGGETDARPWRETWIVNLCGTDISVPMTLNRSTGALLVNASGSGL